MYKKKVFILIIILMVFLVNTYSISDDINEDVLVSSYFKENEGVNASSFPTINARSAIVVDTLTKRVLFEKNAYKVMPMASTTKIMTAIIAMEYGNLDDIVTISKNAANTWGSTMGIKSGQKISLKLLLYGLLMRSGNDAAVAIAEHIAGNVDDFCSLMNIKALEIGAYNSQFKTPHGLDVEGHYTTAYDLALIAVYALQNPMFSEIVSTKTYSSDSYSFTNTNEMLSLYKGANGVKTGYTGKAGRCLVTSATRDGRKFVSVVLFCDNRTMRALSSKKILDYAFENYNYYPIFEDYDYKKILSVDRGVKDTVTVYPSKQSYYYPLTKEEKDCLITNVSLKQNVQAPIKEGNIMGNVTVYLGQKIIFKTDLITIDSVKRKGIKEYYIDVALEWMQLIIK